METKPAASLSMALFALFYPLATFAQQPQQSQWDWPGPWHMWSGGWGFGWMFPLFMLLMILVFAAIFFLGHRSAGRQHCAPGQTHRNYRRDPTHSALQILNERFAKGEIQKQEYEEKREILLSSRR